MHACSYKQPQTSRENSARYPYANPSNMNDERERVKEMERAKERERGKEREKANSPFQVYQLPLGPH